MPKSPETSPIPHPVEVIKDPDYPPQFLDLDINPNQLQQLFRLTQPHFNRPPTLNTIIISGSLIDPKHHDKDTHPEQLQACLHRDKSVLGTHNSQNRTIQIFPDRILISKFKSYLYNKNRPYFFRGFPQALEELMRPEIDDTFVEEIAHSFQNKTHLKYFIKSHGKREFAFWLETISCIALIATQSPESYSLAYGSLLASSGLLVSFIKRLSSPEFYHQNPIEIEAKNYAKNPQLQDAALKAITPKIIASSSQLTKLQWKIIRVQQSRSK